MAWNKGTVEEVLRKAEYYKCKTRVEKDGVRHSLFCPGGWGMYFDLKGTSHSVQDLTVVHPVPYRLNPQNKETPPAARDFEDKFPDCKFSGVSSVMGARASMVEFRCGPATPAYEMGEMMEWLINTTEYVHKVVSTGPDNSGYTDGWKPPRGGR